MAKKVSGYTYSSSDTLPERPKLGSGDSIIKWGDEYIVFTDGFKPLFQGGVVKKTRQDAEEYLSFMRDLMSVFKVN